MTREGNHASYQFAPFNFFPALSPAVGPRSVSAGVQVQLRAGHACGLYDKDGHDKHQNRQEIEMNERDL